MSTAQRWYGAVLPKRHARRAVTRTLIKRQIRAALLRCEKSGEPSLSPGLWVVRLRSPFDRTAYPSAASQALRCAAADELDALLGQASRKLPAALIGQSSARRTAGNANDLG